MIVKIDKVWHRTSPAGTWRVTYYQDGQQKGAKAWYRNGWWSEYRKENL